MEKGSGVRLYRVNVLARICTGSNGKLPGFLRFPKVQWQCPYPFQTMACKLYIINIPLRFPHKLHIYGQWSGQNLVKNHCEALLTSHIFDLENYIKQRHRVSLSSSLVRTLLARVYHLCANTHIGIWRPNLPFLAM